jgi:two-component system NtrC family sensor kinase
MRISRRLWLRFRNLPLRRKLILSYLAVFIAGGVVTLILGTRLEHRTIITLAETKVRHDLASAWMVYNERLGSIRDVVRLSAAREFLQDFFRDGNEAPALAKLDSLRREYGLDVLNLTDDSGRVLARSRRPGNKGDDESNDPLISRALRREVVAGTQIVARAELLREGPDLAERAYFKFIPTPRAAPRAEGHEESGMMLRAAAPVIDDQGRLLGVLYGGLLFNRNFDLVDRVKDIVYKGEKYKSQDIGTATVFQGDLRISTNVLNDQGQRALGTRVSEEVGQAVLREGRTYVGRAFVVSHWYITAYGPIRDIQDRTIGMLYVGMLEKPYVDLRNRVMLTFAGLAGLTALLLLVLLAAIAANITRPLRRLVEATGRVARGELDHRVEIETRDELGQLAGSFNRMTEDLSRASENLTQWGRTLEKRVEERTRELQQTQENLIRSEKLASLGKIAAGVAHEINNPLTSILINTHLLLERPDLSVEDREALALMAQETSRCAEIVKGLLEFSRQRPAQSVRTDVNQLLERTIQLLDRQATLRNIRLVPRLADDLPEIALDVNKIQQVFYNLLLNACEAMPEGGTATVTSRLAPGRNEVEVVFSDTGVGIPRQNLDKLFDPFFSTKSLGTGLGLAVSYGIVRQRGGTIEVDSQPGKGSTFTVKLPLEEPVSDKLAEKVPHD